MSRFTTSGTIKAIERYENVNIHRPINNVPDDRVGFVTINGEAQFGVIEFCRMVLIEDQDGKLYQWFGKGTTKFWSDNFSSKLEDRKNVGDTISISASIKTEKQADNHFGKRFVIQHPKTS